MCEALNLPRAERNCLAQSARLFRASHMNPQSPQVRRLKISGRALCPQEPFIQGEVSEGTMPFNFSPVRVSALTFYSFKKVDAGG